VIAVVTDWSEGTGCSHHYCGSMGTKLGPIPVYVIVAAKERQCCQHCLCGNEREIAA
jgi:hypothetical protein